MTCKKCEERNQPKIYEVKSGPWLHIYDVERALKLALNTPAIDVEVARLKNGLVVNDYDPGHLDHVNLTVPILFGMEEIEDDAVVIHNGKPVVGREAKGLMPDLTEYAVFLDGSHRVARALRDGIKTLKVLILDKRQTADCLIIRKRVP